MKIARISQMLLSPRKRLLNRLAETAADAELLAANLARHRDMCGYPTLKAGLEQLAAAEAEQANTIRQLLFQNGVCPKLPRRPPHDGSSNWERLRSDLAIQLKILRALHAQIPEWTAVEPQVAELLREAAQKADSYIDRLRDLTLKCDPQAID